MKRLFTIAVIAMLTSMAFAQAPLAKKAVSAHKIEKLVNVNVLAQKAKEAKEMKAAMEEKAAAANETSSSMFRKSSVNRGKFESVGGGKEVSTMSLRLGNSRVDNAIYKATTLRTTTQEGNVTVETDANGIITNVTGVEAKYYKRAETGSTYYPSGQQIYIGTQSGIATIIEDGNNVYFKEPITRYTNGSWVKGVKDGNTITVAAHQPLAYSTDYGTTISLRWAVVNAATGAITADDTHAEGFTFIIDGDVLALQGTSPYSQTENSYFMGAMWDDDNSCVGYGDVETVLTYDPTYTPASTELVTTPAGLETTDWYLNGIATDGETETMIKNQPLKVGFDGNDIYVQGISADFPEAWVKGTVDGTDITFEKFQFVGQYQGINCWLVGGDYDGQSITLTDAKATYDADAKTITFTNDVIVNADEFRLYYLSWYFDVVLSGEAKEFEEPIITDLTAKLPYSNTFETTEEQNQAAIYDANEDQSTFSFEQNTTSESMTARYRYSTSNKADDYVVFPGVELKAGKKYIVSLDAASYNERYPECLEVVAGTVAKASQLTIPVIEATTVANKEFTNIKNGEFSVEADGTYYIAIHAISEADAFYLYVDNFSISEADPGAPAAITDLTVTPGEEGALKATVAFSVPDKTVSGTNITEDMNVVITRNGEQIASLTKSAGEKMSFNDDNVPESGYYTYSASVSYGEHNGEAVSQKVYIGLDTPDAVQNLTAADKSGSVSLAWDAPTEGANGYYVNPANFKYNVYPVEIQEFWGMTFPVTDFENPYVTGLTETSANVEFNTNEGDHTFTYFAVTAANEAGESEDTYGAVVTGKPYELPVFESVIGNALSYWWGTACDENNNYLEGGLYLSDGVSSDNDGACFQMVAETAGWMTIESGKIALNGAVNPVLTFDYSGDVAANLIVSVITPKGEKEMTTFTAGTEFAPASVSLKEFANEDWVRVIITGTFEQDGNAFVDNVRIYNQLDNNLVAKSIKATSKVQAGDDVTITVNVENQGSLTAAADAYTVDLYCNDEKVDSKAGVEIAANASADIEFTQTTNIMSPAEMTWKAVVVFEADEDKTNNETATAKTTIKANNYPTVTDLAGTQDGENVVLTWSEPDMTAAPADPVTDSFEEYESFAVNNAGDWSFIDVDGSKTYGFNGLEFPNAGSEMAYMVFDASYEPFTGDPELEANFAAATGNKYMASFAATDGQNDDWMISPELSGDAQTVSFSARTYIDDYGYESFEFYYSTTGKEVSDFIKVDGVDAVPTAWTEYEFNVPAGAKYFAIRCTSQDKFIFLVDDVTYIPAGASAGDLAIVGYNVYRDGEKVNSEPVEETTYTDAAAAEGNHSYVVTVVYDKGESKASNVVTLNVVSGINAINAKGVKVSTGNKTITVTGAAGHNVSVCAIDGKVIFDGEGTDITRIKVNSGVYTIKIDNTTVKAIVK